MLRAELHLKMQYRSMLFGIKFVVRIVYANAFSKRKFANEERQKSLELVPKDVSNG